MLPALTRRSLLTTAAGGLCAPAGALAQPAKGDPLHSWNDGRSKQAIADFVSRVIAEGTPDYVQPSERIAVFDNDGTLWAEQPMYFQGMFLVDRVSALGAKRRGLLSRQPFKAVIEHDHATLRGWASTASRNYLRQPIRA